MVWEVTNSGSQWHEYVIVRGEEGLTQEQLMEMLMAEEEPEGPPPFEVVDYFGPISEGERAWVQVIWSRELLCDLLPARRRVRDFACGSGHDTGVCRRGINLKT